MTNLNSIINAEKINVNDLRSNNNDVKNKELELKDNNIENKNDNISDINNDTEKNENDSNIQESLNKNINNENNDDIDDEDISNEDIDDLDDEDESDEDDKDVIKFRKQFKDSIYKPIDISNFAINNSKTLNLKNVIENNQNSSSEETMSHLINNALYQIKLYKGLDVKILYNILYSRDGYSANDKIIEVLKEFFNHIINKDKELTFNQWLKTVDTTYLPDIYAAIYKSVIYDGDSLVITCDSCKESSIININDDFVNVYMKFESDKDKSDYIEKYNNCDNKFITTESIKNCKLFNINDNLVIGLKMPSLYEDMLLRDYILKHYRDKIKPYETTFTFAIYIDSMYTIENNELIPINLDQSSKIKNNNTIEDDSNKLRLKIKRIDSLLRSLEIKDINVIEIILNEFIENESKTNYKYISPKLTCPLCGHINGNINEEEVSMLELVLIKQSIVNALF